MTKNIFLYGFAANGLLIFMIGFTPAFGHGLAGDMPPPVDLSGKNVTVFVKMDPASLTATAPEDATLGIRFFDTKTDENLEQVTYRVWVKKEGKLLMNDWFYDPSGDLRIMIRPTDTEQVKVYGEKETQLEGWYGRGGPVLVEAPIFLEGGLYNIFVEIFSVETTRQILDPPLQFDAWVSVAEDNAFRIFDNGSEYPVTIKTYFDTIDEFEFDERSDTLTFSMPFNWEPEFTQYVYVVHEEIIVPKDFELFLESGQFEARVNGVPLSDRALLVDPYSFEDKTVIHYLIGNDELNRITEKVAADPYPQQMIFTLRPTEGAEIGKGGSMNLVTDNGKVRILLAWDQEMVEPAKPVKFDLTFFDASANAILRDVNYDLKIFDENGNELLTRSGLYSSEGIDTLTHTFENTGTPTVQVHLMGTGAFVSQMDTSLVGTAEGSIVVVPEFPVSASIAMAGAVAAAILLSRRNLVSNSLRI